MTKLIALDDGHGMKTSGKRSPIFPSGSGLKSETGNFMHENEFNRAVVKYLKEELENNGFKTLLVAPTDEDTSLRERTNLANSKKADIYISVHANAVTGKWGTPKGVETFHHPKSSNGKKLANLVHKYLVRGTKQADRGVKTGDLHVLRETHMPAILVECGFMDNLEEAKLLLSDSFRRECAKEIAQGVCEYFGVPYKTKSVQTAKATKQPVAQNSQPKKSDLNNSYDNDWRVVMAKKALQELKDEGLLSAPEDWNDKLLDSAPNWLVFELFARLNKKLSK